MFTEGTIKIRRHSFILSGLSLFIGLTQSIPSKFTLIGVELNSDGQRTLGVFIFFITLYYFLYFLSTTLPETLKIYTSYWRRKSQKTTGGDTLDLSMKEFYDILNPMLELQELQENNRLSTTAQGEVLQDIDIEIEDKINSSKWNNIYKLKLIQLILEFISPLIIGLWGLGVLGIYMFSPT